MPIQVNTSALQAVMLTLLRHFLTLAGGVLVAKGFVDQATSAQLVDQIAGLVLAVAPGMWAMIRAKLNHDKLVTVASAAPDSVAVLK